MEGVSVCIPIGPYAWHRRWFTECLESIKGQTMEAAHVIIVDDMLGVNVDDVKPYMRDGDTVEIGCCGCKHIAVYRNIYKDLGQGAAEVVGKREILRVWRAPWHLGIPAAPNIGIALGGTDLVFQMSCDDKLKADCLEECWKEWQHRQDPLGYYWVGVEYSHGETQALPCGHAMIHKALWRRTGGFPPEAAVGHCDPIFMSMMLTHAHGDERAGTLYPVAGGRPLYWHREHDDQYTKNQHVFPTAIDQILQWFTNQWEAPKWGRYE